MFKRILFTTLTLGLLFAANAMAFGDSGALGPDGEIYVTRVGAYGVLFPKGNSHPADNVVLTLSVSRSGEVADRVLVPGTEGREIESSPFVVYEETSKSLYLIWQTEISSVSRLLLRSYKDGSFGPLIEVTAGSFGTSMSAPQAAVTRDEFFVPSADNGTATVHRTLLHLIWWEESGTGNEIRYAPVALVEGIYTGWHPVYALNDLDRNPEDPAAAAEVLQQIYRSPRIQSGRNDHSVVVSFANERNGRLTVLDLSVLPGEISYIADRLRSHVIEIGRKKPGSVKAIADRLRSHVIEIGRLHPRVVSMLSEDVYSYVLAVGSEFGENYEGLADAVGNFAMSAATAVLENGRLGEPTDNPEILRLAAAGGDSAAGAPRLQVRRVFSQAAPHTAPAPTTLFSSKDGRTVLIAWDATNQVRYTESSPEGWGETLAVPLSAELTREQAYDFLEQRIRR